MKFICVKNYNSNRNKLIKDIYKFLVTMIPNSIFNYLKISFFQRYLKMNQESIFLKKKNAVFYPWLQLFIVNIDSKTTPNK